MRIVIHGQQAFGKAVAERLLSGADDVVGVFCPPDIEDRPVDPLKALALEEGLALHQLESWKTDAAADLLASLAADLCVMAYVTQLVPQNCLDIPALGTIQYHPSLLPRHRGPNSINWSIIAGETKTGLTVFWPDQGLDTGPILLQKEVKIGPDDTVGSIYFDHLFPLGVAALMEAVELVRSGSAPRITQIEAEASYESWCRAADAEIDWAAPAEKIHCLIRGTDPQPGAWTTMGSDRLNLFGSLRAEGAGAPGEILAVADSGITIAAGEGAITVIRVRPPGQRAKIAAGEYAKARGLGAGSRLGD
ncbi:MAG: methionyl-tRNA formyltransferase [Alphaproteobacteria bacterium]|nr:methionyl-tRNA formyltransferase [Alphaproteobacteria bacterium]MCZ6813592.1 methionyl-tRNA formyltransferase [Alphaproteobacteria bacterium]